MVPFFVRSGACLAVLDMHWADLERQADALMESLLDTGGAGWRAIMVRGSQSSAKYRPGLPWESTNRTL